MAPLEQILGMLPGIGSAMKEMKQAREQVDEKSMGRVEAIINSMTAKERRNHQIINGQRRKRIAKGSGRSVEEVNRLLKQFVQMKKMLKAMGGMTGLTKGKRPNLSALKGLMRYLSNASHQIASGGIEEAAVFPRGGDRLARGARQL